MAGQFFSIFWREILHQLLKEVQGCEHHRVKEAVGNGGCAKSGSWCRRSRYASSLQVPPLPPPGSSLPLPTPLMSSPSSLYGQQLFVALGAGETPLALPFPRPSSLRPDRPRCRTRTRKPSSVPLPSRRSSAVSSLSPCAVTLVEREVGQWPPRPLLPSLRPGHHGVALRQLRPLAMLARPTSTSCCSSTSGRRCLPFYTRRRWSRWRGWRPCCRCLGRVGTCCRARSWPSSCGRTRRRCPTRRWTLTRSSHPLQPSGRPWRALRHPTWSFANRCFGRTRRSHTSTTTCRSFGRRFALCSDRRCTAAVRRATAVVRWGVPFGRLSSRVGGRRAMGRAEPTRMTPATGLADRTTVAKRTCAAAAAAAKTAATATSTGAWCARLGSPTATRLPAPRVLGPSPAFAVGTTADGARSSFARAAHVPACRCPTLGTGRACGSASTVPPTWLARRRMIARVAARVAAWCSWRRRTRCTRSSTRVTCWVPTNLLPTTRRRRAPRQLVGPPAAPTRSTTSWRGRIRESCASASPR
mmetsp:Transcript_2901/g.9476  ORF Transcript_2901/g.9476 Transcript_2901/m.9476 type:complete len:527 (-) Transcript_2901:701-2281(-)